MSAFMDGSGGVIASIYHEFEIENFDELGQLHQAILEPFHTHQRRFDFLATIDPIVGTVEEGYFFQTMIELKTNVNGHRVNAEVFVIFGDDEEQQLNSGVRELSIGGMEGDYGVVFRLRLGEAGAGIENIGRVPRYLEEEGGSTVRLGIRVAVHKIKEIEIITLD